MYSLTSSLSENCQVLTNNILDNFIFQIRFQKVRFRHSSSKSQFSLSCLWLTFQLQNVSSTEIIFSGLQPTLQSSSFLSLESFYSKLFWSSRRSNILGINWFRIQWWVVFGEFGFESDLYNAGSFKIQS